jgi:methyl-accepting chemotaxis protein
MTITKPLRELTHVAERYSEGQLDLKVPGLDRQDEIGNLACALERLGTSIRKAMERLQKKS